MKDNHDDIENQIAKLRKLQAKLIENNNTQDVAEINSIAEKLIDITQNTYDKISGKYAQVRTLELKEFDKIAWNKLLYYIDKYIGKDYKKIKMLDVGTGHGRDLKYALDIGFNTIGVDNSNSFIKEQ